MAKGSITYIRVPVHLLALGLRSAHELAIAGLAVGFDGKGIRMSNSEIARLLNTDRRHIPRLIGKLTGMGYLRGEVENGRRVLHPTDTILVSPPDTILVTRWHQSGDKVTPEEPSPSISEVTEVTERRISKRGTKPPGGKPFIPPTVDEVLAYAVGRGHPDFDAQRFVDFYAAADWHDAKGNPVRNWRQKFISTWEPKLQPSPSQEARPNGHVPAESLTREMSEDEADRLLAHVRRRA